MVFELTDSLIDQRVIDNKVHRDSLHNLFLGYEEGNLILSMSLDLLDFLDSGLDDTLSKRVINRLQNSVLAHYDVLWQTKVVLDNPDTNNHELSIDFFRNSSAIQPPILLCENLDDTRFYFALCKEYFGVDMINTKNGQGGGGSSTADNLEQIVNNKDRFCLCIVDSDVRYPGCDDGGTYVAILNKHLNQHPSYEVFKLTVHEIENLIPITIIGKHIKDKRDRELSKRLIEVDNNGDILKYYDIKEGVKLSAIRRKVGYYQFASNLFERLKKPNDRQSFDEHLAILDRNQSDEVFAPLCPSILETFMNIDVRYHERFVYCDYLREEWDRIRKIIVTFFCARQADPIN